MHDPQLLPQKLKVARKSRGWSVYAAAKEMPGVYLSTLRTLEGSNPLRAPAPGGEMKLKTAVAIATAYFPDIKLSDLMGGCHRCMLRLVPRDSKARKIMKRYQPPPLDEAWENRSAEVDAKLDPLRDHIKDIMVP